MFIVTINECVDCDAIGITKRITEHNWGCKFVAPYKILRIKPSNRRSSDNAAHLPNFLKPDVYQYADIIFDTHDRIFHKHRYGTGNIADNMEMLPPSLRKLMPIIDLILDGKSIQYLKETFPLFTVIEAIYLTNTYMRFHNYIDNALYYVIRHKYNQNDDIPHRYRVRMIEQYPELLV